MRRTILVADDSPTIRKIVELTFSDTDIRVEAAESGEQAMARITALQPDLVLADVAMPDPSGYELCRTIKSSERPVPVVLLAGTFEPFDSDLAHECGADGHLVKPFESETLRDKVQTLLEPPVEEEVQEAVTEESEEVEEAMADISGPPDADEELEEPEAVAELVVDEQAGASVEITDEFIDAIAEAVVQRLSPDLLREIAWEVVPKLATEIIRERIRELEQHEMDDQTEVD